MPPSPVNGDPRISKPLATAATAFLVVALVSLYDGIDHLAERPFTSADVTTHTLLTIIAMLAGTAAVFSAAWAAVSWWRARSRGARPEASSPATLVVAAVTFLLAIGLTLYNGSMASTFVEIPPIR